MQDTSPSLKSRIANGETVVALRTFVTMEPAKLEAALGKASYQLIYLDTQHVPYTEQQLVDLCKAAEELGYPVEIRIPHARHAYLAGRFCDLGPAGILVPEVRSGSEVLEAADFLYYPPVGKRSFGGRTRYGMHNRKFDARSYAAWWNETATLGIQLECVEAIVNARQLVKSGVTYVSFGPNDLQFSLDAHPHFPLRTVDECVRHVAEQLAGTGVALGLAVGLTPEGRQKYVEMGITVFQEFPRS